LKCFPAKEKRERNKDIILHAIHIHLSIDLCFFKGQGIYCTCAKFHPYSAQCPRYKFRRPYLPFHFGKREERTNKNILLFKKFIILTGGYLNLHVAELLEIQRNTFKRLRDDNKEKKRLRVQR